MYINVSVAEIAISVVCVQVCLFGGQSLVWKHDLHTAWAGETWGLQLDQHVQEMPFPRHLPPRDASDCVGAKIPTNREARSWKDVPPQGWRFISVFIETEAQKLQLFTASASMYIYRICSTPQRTLPSHCQQRSLLRGCWSPAQGEGALKDRVSFCPPGWPWTLDFELNPPAISSQASRTTGISHCSFHPGQRTDTQALLVTKPAVFSRAPKRIAATIWKANREMWT